MTNVCKFAIPSKILMLIFRISTKKIQNNDRNDKDSLRIRLNYLIIPEVFIEYLRLHIFAHYVGKS